MKKTSLLALMMCTLPSMTMAHNLTVGETIPAASVAKHGELMLEGDKIAYQAWDSANLTGKVRVVQAIAGRKSAKKLNAPLIDAIIAAELPNDKYQTTTVINQDDAMWGTSSFVKSSAEDSKKEFNWSSIVLDKDGTAFKAWELAEESSAIFVVDQQGTVLFAKEGALTEAEISQVLATVEQNL
ncbi:YtfJ family protein [Vibrio sp. SCSIO 43136]|uniref:YtfJ family protein n=1 Tax=Vibrio sp. SCSIO 43136 TaxID=2819101 RepID=UPI0020753243|nr:YtfJ family protein [Vibrio sp. SCSIO 43136]USD64984.1 YtfJ family protein [Vibrio sp. SCSIO 43136]